MELNVLRKIDYILQQYINCIYISITCNTSTIYKYKYIFIYFGNLKYIIFRMTAYISTYAIICINKSNPNTSYCSFPSEDVAIETQPVF